MIVRGDRTGFARPCKVEFEDVGDATCDANDSTSSMEFACQPLFTLTMAYDRRVRSSEDNWVWSACSFHVDVGLTSPIFDAEDDVVLTVLAFRE